MNTYYQRLRLAKVSLLILAGVSGPLGWGIAPGECSTSFAAPQDSPPHEPTANAADKPSYDPLKVETSGVEQIILDVHDGSREIPLRVYLPKSREPACIILFSHGLGGSRDNSPYLGKHWAGRGYVAVFMQHAGSDESVWKDVPMLERMKSMRSAADGENFRLRVEDVRAVIDQLEKWSKQDDHPLQGRLNLDRIGMTGHSFGAVTTQAVSGQAFLGRTTFTDSRIKAALMMSPSAPTVGNPERAFAKVTIPWLLMTGTADVSLIGNADVDSRKAVYAALPAGDKYELVLDQAEHLAFSDRAISGVTKKRNPNHHRVILALSTAFWDAYLRQDAAAKQWLRDDARQVMEAADTWKHK